MTRYKHQYPRLTYLEPDNHDAPTFLGVLRWIAVTGIAFFSIYGLVSFLMALTGTCPCQ